MTYVVFDIGGTKSRVATSTDLQSLAEVRVRATVGDNFEKGLAVVVDLIKELVPDGPSAIAGGVRGLLNEAHTGIMNDAKLQDWAGQDIVACLQKEFGDIPIFLENDTAIAGVGEATFGAGQNLPIVAYHTVSTGVGGVKIEDGTIDDAHLGFEPGHQILDIDRTILGDDITPTLENLVSGTGVRDRMGVDASDIPQDDVLWDELAGYLGQGLRNTILYWSPDAIVLGGAMITGDPAIPIDAIRKATAEVMEGVEPVPLITKAQLGDEAGLWGGLAVLDRHTVEA